MHFSFHQSPAQSGSAHFTLTLIFEGQLSCRIGGIPCLLSAGDALLTPPDADHLLDDCSSSLRCCSIAFSGVEVPYLPALLPDVLTLELRQAVSLFEQICKGCGAAKEKKLLHLTSVILTMLEEQNTARRQNKHVTAILNYIRLHFQEPITLDSIARAVYLSPNYCSHLIKDGLNSTISALIAKERIQYAQTLILQGKRPLTKVCTLCGYHDYAYFSKQFKRYTSLTPSGFRRLK